MKALSIAFSSLFAMAAALSGSAGLLVIASLFIAERAPQTDTSLGIHLSVGGTFLALGLLLLGILRQVAALAKIAPAQEGAHAAQLRRRLSRLLLLLVISGLFLCVLMAIVNFGILSRIDEGFAVFG